MLDKSLELKDRADLILQGCDHIDLREWQEHPITRALKIGLEYDIHNLIECWSEGQFVTESADGTAQINAKALGQLAYAADMLEYIKEMRVGLPEEEEENDEGEYFD